jgi:hypothetical protein
VLIILALLGLMPAFQESTAEQVPEDIVVTAVRQDCRVRFADREMSDREFNDRAKVWASGKPVRVIARADTDLKCLSKIAFRLADRGVRLIEFVDPSGRSAEPLRVPGLQTAGPTPQTGIRDREKEFISRKAAELILAGKCPEARRLALENGNLEAAANVAQICRTP